ncbi:MAG: hypothetical protein ABEJ26_09605 [Halosimplex sp.]
MSRRSRAALVAAACLLALSGCNAFAPSAEPATDTVTPVPIPTVDASGQATPTARSPTARPELARFPGVSSRRGIDVATLLAAHVRYLSARSYTVTWTRRTAGGTGPVARQFRHRIAVGDDASLRHTEGDRTGPVTTYVGAVAYRRVVADGAATVEPADVADSEGAGERFAQLVAFEVRAFFGNGYDTLDVVERDGRRYARAFTTRPPPELASIYDAYALRNFTATVWVAPQGYVQALHYEFELVSPEDSLAVEWRYAYTDVGETTVERPTWVPANATASPPVAATRTPEPARVPPPTVANATAANETATSAG